MFFLAQEKPSRPLAARFSSSGKAVPSGKAAPSARRALLLVPSRSVLVLLSGLVEEAARERGGFVVGAEWKS